MLLVCEEGMRQALTWRTDVMEAYDGTEQRVCLAPTPRARFEGSILLGDRDLAYLRALLARTPDAAFALPLPFEATPALAEVTGTTVTIDPTLVDWAAVDRVVYVLGPAGDAYTGTISAVAGGDLTLPAPPSGSFPAGSTFVMPVESIALEDAQALGRWVRSLGRWDVRGRQLTSRALGGAGAPAISTLSGYDVLDRRPLSDGGAMAEALGAAVVFQDAGGAVSNLSDWSVAKPRRDCRHLIATRSDRQWWKAFLSNRRGRWSTFLCPTWRPDLELATFTSGAAAVRLSDTNVSYIDRWWPSLAHRWIQLEFRDGSIQRRAVSAVADLGGGVEELTLTAAVTGSPADVVAVSLVELCRLDADDVQIEWAKNMQGRMTLPIIAVQG